MFNLGTSSSQNPFTLSSETYSNIKIMLNYIALVLHVHNYGDSQCIIFSCLTNILIINSNLLIHYSFLSVKFISLCYCVVCFIQLHADETITDEGRGKNTFVPQVQLRHVTAPCVSHSVCSTKHSTLRLPSRPLRQNVCTTVTYRHGDEIL